MLWAQPIPLELLVRTDFDLETGKVQITDLVSPRVARETGLFLQEGRFSPVQEPQSGHSHRRI